MILMNNKKILIVTHQYLPLNSPRTTRWKLLSDQLTLDGFEVKILTATIQFNDEKNNNVIFLGGNKTSNFINNLREESKKENLIIKKNLLNILKKIYRFLFKTFSWPDYAMFWLLTIYKNRKKINYDYDHIISVSLPFSSHVAAYIINKSKKKNWIIDVGDPFSLKTDALENNKYIFNKLNIYFENKFYKLANQIIFTHSDVAQEHIRKFKINQSKVLIGNPISSINEQILLNSKNYDYSSVPLVIGYFGILTDGVRTPKSTLKYFDNTNFIFNWYTNIDSKKMINQFNFNKANHRFFELVGREEALNKMTTTCHCLLSIGNLNSSQLPSKVIEYLATGKPILHFAEIESDPIIKIAEKFQNLIIVTKNTDLDELNDKIHEAFYNIEKFNTEDFLNNYSAISITKNLNIF